MRPTKSIISIITIFLLTSCSVPGSPEQTVTAPPPTIPTETQLPVSTATSVPPSATPTPAGPNTFEPPDGKVLLFIGQDNDSIGGHDPYRDGYVDNVGMPAGVTAYVYMVEGWTNRFGYTFDVGSIDGLNEETTWGGGPACLKCILDSPTFAHTIIHVSISMVDGSEAKIADGTYDYLIDELVAFFREYQDHPFFLRHTLRQK